LLISALKHFGLFYPKQLNGIAFMVHELLRVRQEFLQNTIKHTQNFSVAIRIHFTKDHVRIEMQSNTPQFAIQPAGATGAGNHKKIKKIEEKMSFLTFNQQAVRSGIK
jgi:signal transduction histidine kinase